MAILTQDERRSLISWIESHPEEAEQLLLGRPDRTSVCRQLRAEETTGTPGTALHEFLSESWHVLEPHPFCDSAHVHAICNHAEACILGEIKRLLINIPPGMSKSVVMSVVLPCWVWTFRPWFRWLCGSYDQPTADDFSQKRRNLLSSKWYRERWPESANLKTTEESKQRDTIRLIQNSKGGEMLATSPKGRALGKHPHGICIDDPHNPKAEKSLGDVSLKDVRNWIEGVVSTRGVASDVDVRVMMIMQRLAVGDGSDVLREIGCEHLMLPMRFDPMHSVRDPALPTSIGFVDWRTRKGELLCPQRYPEETVQTMERVLRHRATGQLQQMPQNPEGDRFKRPWFRVIPPSSLPADIYTHGKAVRYWDKAGTEGGGDWTSGVLIVHYGGKCYVMDVVRGQWNAANRKLQIKQTSGRDDSVWSNYVVWTEQEPGSGGKESAENTMFDLQDHRVRIDKVRDTKHVRYNDWEEELDCTTNPREPTVFLAEGAWTRDFIDEHCNWQWEDKSPVDDQIDAASGAYIKLRRRKAFLAV